MALGIVAVAPAADASARRRLTWNPLSALNFPVTTGTPSPRPHIIAASAALLALVLALAGGWVWCERLETRFVDALSRDLSEAKLQGVALQRDQFRGFAKIEPVRDPLRLPAFDALAVK